MTPTQRLCATVGITPELAAKQLRMHPRTLARFINHGCCQHHAGRIAAALQCDVMIFIRGYAFWAKHLSGHNKDGCGRRSVTVAPGAHVSRRNYIPTLMRGGVGNAR